MQRNHYTDRIEQQTGALLGQIWKVDGAPVLPSRTATVPFSPSSFCHFSSSSTCYYCLFDQKNGRKFCEIMVLGYCTTCIKTNRRNENDEEVINALGTSVNKRFASLFGDTILQIKQSPTLASSTGRELFNRLDNFNPNSKVSLSLTMWMILPKGLDRSRYVANLRSILFTLYIQVCNLYYSELKMTEELSKHVF